MPRPVARLHSGLMARKGDALPTQVPMQVVPSTCPSAHDRQARALETGPEPGPQDSFQDSPRKTGEVRQCSSVRLTAEQRRRLRAAAAALGLSHQDLLARSLDRYLDELSRGDLRGCACVRRRADAF